MGGEFLCGKQRIMRIDESIDLLTRKIGEFFENILKASLVKKLLRKRSRTDESNIHGGNMLVESVPRAWKCGETKSEKKRGQTETKNSIGDRRAGLIT